MRVRDSKHPLSPEKCPCGSYTLHKEHIESEWYALKSIPITDVQKENEKLKAALCEAVAIIQSLQSTVIAEWGENSTMEVTAFLTKHKALLGEE